MGFGRQQQDSPALGAMDFLRTVASPNGGGTVVAINPISGACVGRSYDAANFSAAEDFITAHKRYNLYWTPNSVRKGINKSPRNPTSERCGMCISIWTSCLKKR
jgi:hypothetical protein